MSVNILIPTFNRDPRRILKRNTFGGQTVTKSVIRIYLLVAVHLTFLDCTHHDLGNQELQSSLI